MTSFKSLSILAICLLTSTAVIAATPVNLMSYRGLLTQTGDKELDLKQTRKETDANHMTHIHVQQMYHGLPVFGATGVLHSLNGNVTGNGVVYLGLDKDLKANYVKSHTIAEAQSAAKKLVGMDNVTDMSTDKIIYIDEKNQAHYAYEISFFYSDGKTIPHRPVIILDAGTLHAYKVTDRVRE